MNLYVSKVSSNHLFVIFPQKDEFEVTKPDGKTYKCSLPQFPQDFLDLDNFITNNEIISKLTDQERKDKAVDLIIKGINSSVLNYDGYDLFEILLNNSFKLVDRNFLLSRKDDVFILQDLDNEKKIKGGSVQSLDDISKFLGINCMDDTDDE